MNALQTDIKIEVEASCKEALEHLKRAKQSINGVAFDWSWLHQAEKHLEQAMMCTTKAIFEKIPRGKK